MTDKRTLEQATMATVRVERDDAPDADEHGGWRVVYESTAMWKVLFRGDIAECEDFAETETV